MTGLNEILGEVSVFQVSDNEIHLYLGTYHNPGSSIIIIRGQSIGQPTRTPPISKENLLNRYSISKLQIETIFPKIRLLLALFGLIEIDIITEADFSDTETEDNFIITQPWEAEIEQVDDFILPMTDELRELINSQVDQNSIVKYFMNMLGDPSRSNRQKALSKLVSQNNETVNCLLSIFLMVRSELTVAIIREFGRQGVNIQSAISQCYGLIETNDKAYEHFAFAYLSQFDKANLEKTNYAKKLIMDKTLYLDRPMKYRLQKIISTLKNNDRNAAESMKIWVQFDDDSQLQFEISSFLRMINPKKINIQGYRSALTDLLQYAETSQSTKIYGLVLALASLYDKLQLDENYYFQTELNGEFKHIRQRIISQAKLWLEIDDTPKISETIAYFFTFIPSPQVDIKNQSERLGDLWIENHPILRLFSKQVDKIWRNNKFVGKIVYHSTQVHLPMIRKLLDSNNWEINLDELSFLQQIIVKNNFPDIVEEQVRDSTTYIIKDDQLGNFQKDSTLISHLSSANCIISRRSFHTVCKNIITNQEDIEHLRSYIQMISKNVKDKLKIYFEVLSEIILNNFDIDNINVILKEIILKIMIPWQSLTGTFPEEKEQQFIDTFKIIFQSEVEEFDLESSKPLGIETIANCYKITKGEIPKFVESNIQFSFTKPVWDQLARHYLALGISRPKREAIAKSKLKDIPNYLTRDVLGQIALVNQTISYCERNGFRPALENLIINNMYKRGWNVERGLERMLPSLFGSISPRLRSYFSAYLVIDQGEISLDILKWARDVEDFLLRDRILRELDRYGTADMWVVLANAYHEDIQKGAISALKETRMNATERSKITIDLISSPKIPVQQLGIEWLQKFGVQQDDILTLFTIDQPEVNDVVINYLADNQNHLGGNHQQAIYDLLRRNMWRPGLKQSTKENLLKIVQVLRESNLKNSLREELMSMIEFSVPSRKGLVVNVLAVLE